MKVSVVIPAYNAAETIADTLESLLDQTYTDWEAIVVDDGSTDRTVEVVSEYIQRDKRISIFSQENQGLSGARNSGVRLAQYDWLLFLDSDDWILPSYLQRMTDAIRSDPSLDVVYCGWAYALPDGELVFPQLPCLTGDLFIPFSQYCVSVVHTFLVPRSLVLALGPFNTTMRSCEDWSLWQRIARTGARFGAVTEILAAYRTRPDSLSRNGQRLLKDGTYTLVQGHRPDPQVQPPHPLYGDGAPEEDLVKCKFDLLCACAGYLIGGGKDAKPLLEQLQGETCSVLQPEEVAQCVVIHALVSASRPREQWTQVWADCQPLYLDFLKALEQHSGTENLVDPSYLLAQKRLKHYVQAPSAGHNRSVYQNNLTGWTSHNRISPTYKMKNLIKRSVWTAPLMIPALREPMQQMRQTLVKQGYVQPPQHPSRDPKKHFEQLFTDHPDPWSYTNQYEQTKYEQTMELLPNRPIGKALELACAEGHFTIQFAPMVGELLATDISETALERCRQRCEEAEIDNVEFQCLDFLTETITGRFDVITCSEVLYFAGERESLKPVVENIANALNPEGYLVMTHSNVLIDDPKSTGFDWDHGFGAKYIGEAFASSPKLKFVKELRTPLYRIQLFQRCDKKSVFSDNKPDVVEFLKEIEYQHLPPDIAQDITYPSAKPLTVLTYGSINPANQDGQGITPETFENHLRYLAGQGYRSETVQSWGYSALANRSGFQKPVAIVFDSAYADIPEYALPLLEKYGFSATVLLYAEEVGKTAATCADTGKTIDLMTWQQVRQLQGEGLQFACRGLNRQGADSSNGLELWRQAAEAKATLESELGDMVSTFAYSQPAMGPATQYLIGLAGYDFAIALNKHDMHDQSGKQASVLSLPCLRLDSQTNIETALS